MSVVAAVLSTSETENMPKPLFCVCVLDYARAWEKLVIGGRHDGETACS